MDLYLLGAIGLAGGWSGAFILGHALGRMLRGVPGADLTSLLGTVGVLLFTAIAANSVPALRASRLNPIAVLRRE